MAVVTLLPPPDWPKMVTLSGIAAEFGDIVFHPVERRDDVEHADIAAVGIFLAAQLRQIEKTERVQPVIDRHQHHIMLFRQHGAVIADIAAGAAGEAAAMAPQHDRALLAVAKARRPDIQAQAILAHRGAIERDDFFLHESRRVGLGRAIAERGGIAHIAPGHGWLRRHEAIGARGGGAIGHALEYLDGAVRGAADFSVFGVHHRGRRRGRTRQHPAPEPLPSWSPGFGGGSILQFCSYRP